MTSYASNLEELAHWIGRQIEWSGGWLASDELVTAPLGDDIDGRPAGILIPRQVISFADDLYRLQVMIVIDRELAYRGYSYQFMTAVGGLIWRFDKHPLDPGEAPAPHLHLPDDEDKHLPYREVELNEVIDWVHRYVATQETPGAE